MEERKKVLFVLVLSDPSVNKTMIQEIILEPSSYQDTPNRTCFECFAAQQGYKLIQKICEAYIKSEQGNSCMYWGTEGCSSSAEPAYGEDCPGTTGFFDITGSNYLSCYKYYPFSDSLITCKQCNSADDEKRVLNFCKEYKFSFLCNKKRQDDLYWRV